LPLPTSAHDALHGLAWYAREALQLERLFGAVTVKRRRNTASPVTRRKSAFRDRKICMDFLAMAWLGATRLSQIKPYLEPRPELARAFGLRRFCDHTTAHNFLNACHKTHVAQLDRVNERLLREHGVALAARAPILDIGTAQRRVRHAGRRPDTLYRWGVAFSAGEAFTQLLDADGSDWPTLARRLFRLARERLDHKPALVRLPGTCASQRLFRAIRRERVDFLIRVSWSWARAHLSNSRADVDWQNVPGLGSVCDVSDGAHFRTVFVQQAPDAPGMDPPRFAMVTSLRETPAAALVPLSASQTAIRPFFGHPRWPLGDGKMPSSGPRGNAAYLLLATIATNVLELFSRQLGEGWNPSRLRHELRAVPPGAPSRQEAATREPRHQPVC
jgi:hypothetical protein